MKIAIDISPLNSGSGHSVRGVGSYIRLLRDNLEKFDFINKYTFFEDRKQISEDTDVIHYPYFDPFRLFLPKQKMSSTIITIHDLTPVVFSDKFPAGIRGNINWKIQKRIIPKLGGVITDSNSAARDVERFTKINQKKVFPIHLAVSDKYSDLQNPALVEKIYEKYNLPKTFVLYVGDVTWNKNLPFVLASCIQANIPLVLVGKAITEKNYDASNPWNYDRKIVQSLIAQNSELLVPLGFVPDEDLGLIYKIAKALVMPSMYEGFGLPVLEAMQSGCPVITSKNGSLPEVGGDAVYYIDSEKKSDLITALEIMIKNESERLKFIQGGLIQSKKFTIKKMISETVRAYEQVGSKK